MIKETYNDNIGISYFYKLYKKLNITFPKGYFFNLKTRRKRIAIDRKLFKNITRTYFNIYFTDFYNSSKSTYFPLSGELTKAKGKKFFKNKNHNIKTESINWIWTLRPALNYFTNIRILKMKGMSKITSLEEEFKLNNDVELLEDTLVLLKKLDSNHKLYKA